MSCCYEGGGNITQAVRLQVFMIEIERGPSWICLCFLSICSDLEKACLTIWLLPTSHNQQTVCFLHVHAAHGFHCAGDQKKNKKKGKEKERENRIHTVVIHCVAITHLFLLVPITAEFLNSVANPRMLFDWRSTFTKNQIFPFLPPSHLSPKALLLNPHPKEYFSVHATTLYVHIY